MTTLTPPIEETGTGLRRSWRLLTWNLGRALIITRREVVDMFRDWRIIAPVLILTVIFPYIANWGAGRMMRWVGKYGAEIVGERLIPFLLLVVGFFPTSFSLIIALESFVGEKERRSLEPLLSTPLTNTQLYIGKTLSSTIPPLVGSLLGIGVYLASLYYNIGWKPPFTLLILVLLLTTAQALVMVAGAVVVSSQTTSVRAANLLASFIILPMAFLVQAEAFVMFWANYGVLWLFLLGLLIVGFLLVRMGIRIFNREELLGREIDELNLVHSIKKWFHLTLARRSEGPRRSAWQWYREEVLHKVGRLWKELLFVTITMSGGYLVGLHYVDVFRIPPGIFFTDDFATRFQSVLAEVGFTGLRGILRVVIQNARVLVVASVLAVFSFGVLAVLVLMIPLALIGYLAPQMVSAGLPPLTPWVALIPHSLFEIPAAILAGAAALRLGTSLIAPPPGKTVGDGWMEALADATRLWWTLILPLLVVAATVEVCLTPRLVGMVLGGG
jgi:uncharacterized membrane protein SpoIIM required for sporulation/ABC-type transport system involved in multi-copper enzyme maturation permease subunit